MESLIAIEQALLEKRETLKSLSASLREARTAVANARSTLEANDYKRHKNIEYTAMGLELPYPWEEIHSVSQALRDIINENEPKRNVLLEEVNTLSEEIRSLQKEYRERKNILQNPLEDILEDIVDDSGDASETEEGEVWAFETTGN